MPELPEVETVKRDLEKKVKGLTIVQCRVIDSRIIKDLPAKTFQAKVRGVTIHDIQRRGKSIVLTLGEGRFLVVHLKMTGQLIYARPPKALLPDTKAVFLLSNGDCLLYNDQRLFGWLIYTTNPEKLSYFQSLGPEPFDQMIDRDWLSTQFQRRQAPIKTVLMNQQIMAGIGNIYASEILFNAGVNPQRPANRLRRKEIERLQDSIRSVLTDAITMRGTSMRNYRDADGNKGEFMNRIKVYGRDGALCTVCRTPIARIVQAGRSTFYCKECQK